jgi:hypothetical protein
MAPQAVSKMAGRRVSRSANWHAGRSDVTRLTYGLPRQDRDAGNWVLREARHVPERVEANEDELTKEFRWDS